MKLHIVLIWTCRIIAAVILLQTLFFKFTGAPESVYIFSQLGMEPWGRIGTGIVELIASVLILTPRLSVFGAFLAMGLMAGAIASHLFVLGIEIMGDGGQLFIYACMVLVASAVIVISERKKLAVLFNIRKMIA